MAAPSERLLAGIRGVALDVDGVLTDDAFHWGPDGEEWKRFVFADVMGISRATKAGLVFALISGEASPLVDRYARKMGIADVFKGTKDKAAALREFAARHGFAREQLCFVGNDVNDLGAMQEAGLAGAPADAHPSALAAAALVASRTGGHGAVREILDRLMAARDAESRVPPAGAPTMKSFFQQELEAHRTVLEKTVEEHGALLEALTGVLVDAFRRGNKVMFCGNGGSAADSQHVTAEFINRFRFDRAPLPALALTVDTSVLTCIANDSAYEQVFARQVEALAKPGDVLVGISTSGKSPNVLAALKAGRKAQVVTVGLTGANGAAHMGAFCDWCLAIPSTDTARIQEAHEFALHSVAARVEQIMFKPEAVPQVEAA